jgi:hypothetical protein
VEIVTRQGQWSEGTMSRADTEVVGKEIAHLLEVKTQSNFYRRGEGCMFDQVYFLP